MTPRFKRFAIILVFAVASLPLYSGSAGDKKAADKNEFFHGKVVRLADWLATQKIKIDPDRDELILLDKNGKVYPLLKDEGSRMFYKDAKLLNRPMRLTARRIPNSPFLQVITVHSVIKGKLHDVYYWCDICTIKRFQAGICDCCLAPLELREPPYAGE
ncbi:MAG: hypothetical protein HYX68_09375 [Planctomycetes bacterium]|nr:hypothetical protein [Planctomycetota bacterium]